MANPHRPEFLGVGGFNLVRRRAYDALGTHRALALEVADDLMLGKRVKDAGFASDVIDAADQVTVRWQEGLTGLMGGLVKNAYAGFDYNPRKLLWALAQLGLGVCWPALGVFFARRRRTRAACGIALAEMMAIAAHRARAGHIPIVYALTLPLGTILMIGVILRSTYVTERQGGITWRGTFYPLDQLRANRLPPPPPLAGLKEDAR